MISQYFCLLNQVRLIVLIDQILQSGVESLCTIILQHLAGLSR